MSFSILGPDGNPISTETFQEATAAPAPPPVADKPVFPKEFLKIMKILERRYALYQITLIERPKAAGQSPPVHYTSNLPANHEVKEFLKEIVHRQHLDGGVQLPEMEG